MIFDVNIHATDYSKEGLEFVHEAAGPKLGEFIETDLEASRGISLLIIRSVEFFFLLFFFFFFLLF